MRGMSTIKEAKKTLEQELKDLEKNCTLCRTREAVTVCMECGTRFCRECGGPNPVCYGCAKDLENSW